MLMRAIKQLLPAAVALGCVSAAPAMAAASGPPIVDLPVSFTVQNLDRTAYGPTEQLTCPADPAAQGATWTVRAHLVAPAAALRRPGRSVTVYVHGLAVDGDTSFHFRDVPGYDLAGELARRGHTSVVIDRIGYGPSSHPDGRELCTGAEADMLHQVVQHLRSGDYGGPSFQRVALAGHSAGGLLAQIEAYTFHDVDALAVLSYEDQGFTPLLLTELGRHAARCATAASGYAPTFDDRTDAVAPADNTAAALFSQNADPRVVADVIAVHPADPCGENPLPYIASDPVELASVTVPVLLVYGADDALLDPALAPVQASHFGSRDVHTLIIPRTGHLLMLERTTPVFRSALSTWLHAHRF
jgi:pimeloyl-ACP methyl ester carboxylesterase